MPTACPKRTCCRQVRPDRPMPRIDQRKNDELRPVRITRGFTDHAPGSVLITCGGTRVLCTACFQQGVPGWKEGSGTGWCTAEYDMLPASTHTRKRRARERLDGRTQEIQRLIGRSLRAVLDLKALGENSILVDCDVIQADGGTRTASITGAYVAVADAIQHAIRSGILDKSPLLESVAAISVGIVGRHAMLDLCYAEDVDAKVDMNVVQTGNGRFVEVQGTGEGTTFSPAELNRMLKLAAKGIRSLSVLQTKTLARRKR